MKTSMTKTLCIFTIACFSVAVMSSVTLAGDKKTDYEKIAKDMGKKELPNSKKITQQWLLKNTGKTFYEGTNVYVIVDGKKSRDMQLAVDKAKFEAREKLAKMLCSKIDCDHDEIALKGTSTKKTAIKMDGNKFQAVVLMKLPLKENM